MGGEVPYALANADVGAIESKRGERLREFRDGRCVTAAVVVEDDHHALIGVSEVVEGLVGHTPGERSVAHHGHDVALAAVTGEFAAVFQSDGETVGVGERGGGVARLDPVVRALGAVRVPRQPTALAQARKLVASTGDQFVRVGLMARVPEQDVLGRVEHSVQCQSEFDDAEIRTEVPAGRGDRRDDQLADLLGEGLSWWYVSRCRSSGPLMASRFTVEAYR